MKRTIAGLGLMFAFAAGFLALIAWSARDWFLPATPVSVVPVILAKAELQQAGTAILAQATGPKNPMVSFLTV